MLVTHKIDHDKKVIISIFAPEEVRLEFFLESYSKYQDELRYLPDFQQYNTLVDFRPITSFHISTSELKKFSSLHTPNNDQRFCNKMALLVKTTPKFSFAKIYEMVKSFNPVAKNQVKVFSNEETALAWLLKE